MKKIFTPIICCLFALSTFAQTQITAPKSILPGHTNDVNGLSYSAKNNYLATAGWDNTINIYSGDTTFKLIKTIKAHLAPVTTVKFNNAGNLLASGSNDFSVGVYDSLFKKIRDYADPTAHQSNINAITFDNKGKFIFSGDERGKIVLWAIDANKKVRVFENGVSVNALTLGTDPKFLFVAGAEPTIKVLNVATGQVMRSFVGHTDAVNAIEISPNQNYLLSGSNDKSARIWDLKTGKEIRKLPVDCWKVTAVAFTFDSKYCATGCNDGSVKVWEVETGKLIQNIPAQSFNTRDLCFFKNYTQMAVAPMLKEGTDYGVRIYPTSIVMPAEKGAATAKPLIVNKNQAAIDSIIKIRPLNKQDSIKLQIKKPLPPAPAKPIAPAKLDSVRIYKTPSKKD